MTRPPLREVARRAGVSEPTVSRVLNGREGVAAGTRARVVAALHTMGFYDVPEPQAARRHVVGLVCGEFLNPVFAGFAHHISAALGRKGYLTTIAVTDRDQMPEERCIDELVRNGVAGVIFIGGRHTEVDGDHSHYRELAAAGVPMAFVNGSQTGIDAAHIRCDEEIGARKAVAHLIGLGHSRIGCLLGSPRYVPTMRFISGYRQALTEAGLAEPTDAIIDTAFTLEGGRAGAMRLFEDGFTAAIAGNDLMAIGAIAAARSLGLHVPDEISVVGYDGTDMTALTSPPLTTLRQPFEDMAQLVTDAIIAEIVGASPRRDDFVFEPQLVLRESTAPSRPTAASA